MAATEVGILDELTAATSGAARPAEAGDTVCGVPASFVASPADTAEAAAVLGAAARHGLAVVARGAGSKLDWGSAPARLDLIVDTTRMDRLFQHAAGDLVVTAGAGTLLEVLQGRLAGKDQRLAVDPVVRPGVEGAGTVGGLVAAAGTGPLRLSHGAVRDLLIGVTFVRADGTVAKAGGRVVKNVAGYDLGKLLTGSFGTLGLVTEAIFRLHPRPALSRWVVAPAAGAAAAEDAVQAVIHSQIVPAALEVDFSAGAGADPGGTVAVLVEGNPAAVGTRAEAAAGLLGADAAFTDSAPPWWGTAPWEPGGTALRLTHELRGLGRLAGALAEAASGAGLAASLRGSAAVGVLHAGLPAGAEPARVVEVVERLRSASKAWGGDVVVLDAPTGVRAGMDMWGPVRGLELMRRVKDQFDPNHRLAPGRFVGGI